MGIIMMTEQVNEKKKGGWGSLVSVLMIGMLLAAYFGVGSFREFINEAYRVLSSNDQERISGWVDQFGWWGPLMILVIMIAQMFLFVIPSLIVMIVTILAYGPLWGSVITVGGIMVVSALGYSIGAYLGPRMVKRLVGEKAEKKLCGFMKDYGVWAVIIARINPFLSNDATSFVAGLLRMGFWRFLGGTFAGILPLTLGIALLGENIEHLKTALLWASLVSVVALVIYMVYKWKRKKKEQDPQV